MCGDWVTDLAIFAVGGCVGALVVVICLLAGVKLPWEKE